MGLNLCFCEFLILFFQDNLFIFFARELQYSFFITRLNKAVIELVPIRFFWVFRSVYKRKIVATKWRFPFMHNNCIQDILLILNIRLASRSYVRN